MLTRLTTFYRTYEVVVQEMEEVSRDERKLQPPGADVATIRRQQQEFRKFKTTRVETLSVRVDETNKTGQGLVQSAAHGVKTAMLEGDLEKMNDLWNDLKARVGLWWGSSDRVTLVCIVFFAVLLPDRFEMFGRCFLHIAVSHI